MPLEGRSALYTRDTMPHRCLKRILVVDDDPDLLAVVALALTALGGFDVLTCTSSREAVEVAEREDPDRKSVV